MLLNVTCKGCFIKNDPFYFHLCLLRKLSNLHRKFNLWTLKNRLCELVGTLSLWFFHSHKFCLSLFAFTAVTVELKWCHWMCVFSYCSGHFFSTLLESLYIASCAVPVCYLVTLIEHVRLSSSSLVSLMIGNSLPNNIPYELDRVIESGRLRTVVWLGFSFLRTFFSWLGSVLFSG